jgi:hypothetical protein
MFRDAVTGVNVEIITTDEFPDDGKPKSVQFPEPVAIAVEQFLSVLPPRSGFA